MIDSHCHLDAGEFDHDRAAVIARAQAAGVMQQVVPAITAASWPGLRAVCDQAPGLHPAYGLHPLFLEQHRPAHLQQLAEWIERERPCAIGECGLDFFVDGLDAHAQRDYFDAQLQLAKRFDLPLIVHARRATEEVIARIKAVGDLPPRQSLARAGGPHAAAAPVAGNRRAGSARRRHPRPTQRAGVSAHGIGLHRPAARARSCAHCCADVGQRTQLVRPTALSAACALARAVSTTARRPHHDAATASAAGIATAALGLSNMSSALPTATNAKVPVICVAAPSPAPQSSLSVASASSCGRMPQTLPSACGYFTFSSEYTAGTPK
ncbi:hypothetical protein XAC29_07410 [Xanthomonas axonopodis Xac29-1]|nr:hypothetical protein XAC29_07410 [Xanthomonas axonopodis Xac29-1]QYF39508.1 hypothetical protein HZS92_01570 [Xanthomonas citri pv. citri]QYF44283.1 hypothetical protein HZS93_01572 [Xanthomonas citri]